MEQPAISFNGNIVITNDGNGIKYLLYNPNMKNNCEFGWKAAIGFLNHRIPSIDFNELPTEAQLSVLRVLGIEPAYLERDFGQA